MTIHALERRTRRLSTTFRRRAGVAFTALVTSAALVVTPVVAAPALAVDEVDPTAVVAPATAQLTGDLRVGQSVTAETGAWTPLDAALSYAWWQSTEPYEAPVDGADHNESATLIEGATTSALTLDAALGGRYVWAVVTGMSGELTPASIVAGGAAPVALPSIPDLPTVSIQGGAVVGSSLAAVLSAPAAEGVTATYEWRRNGTPIDGAESAEYVAVVADLDAQLTAAVTFHAEGYDPTIRVSAPVVVGKATLTPVPAVSLAGSVRVDSPVTADTGAWPAGTTFTYSWRLVDGNGVVAVSKNTTQTFIPTAGALGRKLYVVVTGTVPGHNPASSTSAKTAIAAGVFTATPTPTIVGSSYVGATLKVSAGTWSPTPTLSYRWKRNGVSISGATGTSYKLTSYDYGKKITVTVGAKRTAYTSTSRTSASTTTITKPFTTATAPKISGTARAGVTLTALVGTWSPTPSYSYQWKRDGVAVAGATGKTYALTTADLGARMTVTVTYKRSGYYTRVLTTSATSPVAVATTMTADGLFEVGREIAPGTYYSTYGNDCYFERRADADAPDYETALGYQYWYGADAGGQKVITILSTDEYFFTDGCGTWRPIATSLRTSVGDGTWVVGKNVKAGLWRAKGPFNEDGCYIEFLRSFTGDHETDFIEGGMIDTAPHTTEIYVTDKGFMTDGCGTWTYVGP